MEILGWIGSAFVLISFLYEGRRLRALNSIGAGLWLVYGIVGGMGSIIFLNGAILLIHLRKLSIKRGEKISLGKSTKKILKKTDKKNFRKSTRP